MISIIISVHNSEKYLKECLDSITKQTFKDFECICVIDSSGDNSLVILRKYAGKDKRFIIIEKSSGTISASRNAGLAAAKGEFVYFIDSDDYITEDYLDGLYKVASDTKSSIVVNPDIILVYPAMQKIMPEINYAQTTYSITPKTLPEITGKVYLWNRLFKTSFLKSIDLKFPDIRMAEDLYLYYCLMPLAGEISISRQGRYFYRQSQEQATRVFTNKTQDFFTNTYNLIKDFYRKNGLEREWQIPIYCLSYQFRYNLSAKTFRYDYENIRAAVKDTVIHKNLLSKAEKSFIKALNRGYVYCFITIYLKITAVNFIKSVFRPFLYLRRK